MRGVGEGEIGLLFHLLRFNHPMHGRGSGVSPRINDVDTGRVETGQNEPVAFLVGISETAARKRERVCVARSEVRDGLACTPQDFSMTRRLKLHSLKWSAR